MPEKTIKIDFDHFNEADKNDIKSGINQSITEKSPNTIINDIQIKLSESGRKNGEVKIIFNHVDDSDQENVINILAQSISEKSPESIINEINIQLLETPELNEKIDSTENSLLL